MNPYGAYLHARPDGRVFYVGKGKKVPKQSVAMSGYKWMTDGGAAHMVFPQDIASCLVLGWRFGRK